MTLRQNRRAQSSGNEYGRKICVATVFGRAHVLTYIPTHFGENRPDEILRIIDEFPLATLVTTSRDGLDANHLPLFTTPSENRISTLIGHIARNNPLFDKVFDGADVIAIFRTEDAYISPNWYPTKQVNPCVVPTWNYQSVHIHGKIELVDDTAFVRNVVSRLTRSFEQKTNAANGWKMADAPADYLDDMLAAIVGIRVHVDKVIAKSKLSQNRPAADRASVAENLERIGKSAISRAMTRLEDEN